MHKKPHKNKIVKWVINYALYFALYYLYHTSCTSYILFLRQCFLKKEHSQTPLKIKTEVTQKVRALKKVWYKGKKKKTNSSYNSLSLSKSSIYYYKFDKNVIKS